MAEPCVHSSTECLNHFETIRKYRCQQCSGVFICECDHDIALKFLPHQTGFGTEYGTRQRIIVTGFARGICAACRGEREAPHPRAAGRGRSKVVDRYYWREIVKTYYSNALKWLQTSEQDVDDVFDFEKRFPEVSERLHGEARSYWQQVHRDSPLYENLDRSQSEFFSAVPVKIREIDAEYVQVEKDGKQIGKWRNKHAELVNVEDIAREFYESQGLSVVRCERQVISALIAVFLARVIQDRNDPNVRLVMRNSTQNWRPNTRDTPTIEFPLPVDFGSAEFYERRNTAISAELADLAEAPDLIGVFRSRLRESESLRDYLWVNSDLAIESASVFLGVVPASTTLQSVHWAIRDFWNRQPGWPDFLIHNTTDYFFAEVKSAHDQLSQDQMNWFQWAINTVQFPCEILKIKKKQIAIEQDVPSSTRHSRAPRL